MQSKTSSFNGYFSPALFRKDLARFWPLWALYTAIWLFALPLMSFLTLFGNRNSEYYTLADRISDVIYVAQDISIDMAVVMGLIFGCLFAAALFLYLTTPRAVGFAHALPLRREGHFLTHFAAGASVFLGAQALTLGLTAAIWAAGGVKDLSALGAWFLCAAGAMLFFFCFAVFCAMFAGQALAVPVFYGVFNGLAVALTVMLQSLGETFFYGYSASSVPAWVEWLTPVYKLMDSVGYSYMYSEYGGREAQGFYGLGVVGVYALAGLALAAAALFVCKYRRSEAAGDVVAIGWARPVFRYGVGLCAALTLGQFLYFVIYQQFTGYSGVSAPALALCMILAGLLGYYLAEMLLQKSFRVFKAGWKGGAALSAALVLLCAGYALDLPGVAARVPDPGQIRSLTFGLSGGNYLSGQITDPDTLAKFTELHRAIVDQRPDDDRGWSETDGRRVNYGGVRLDYTLNNGMTLRRYYGFNYMDADLENPESLAGRIAALRSDPAVQLSQLPDETRLQRVTGARIDRYDYGQNEFFGDASGDISASNAKILLDAFFRDVKAGHAGIDQMDGTAWEENTYVNTLYVYYTVQDRDGSSYGSTLDLSFSKHYTYLLDALVETGTIESTDQLVTQAQMNARYSEDAVLAETYRGEAELSPDSVTFENPSAASAAVIGGGDGPTAITAAGEPAAADTVG